MIKIKMGILPLVSLVGCLAVHAADIEITSFAKNGLLTWTNSFTNGLFSIEWAPALGADWHDNWGPLQNFAVSGTTTTAEVPMFYRVKCVTNLFVPFPMGSLAVFSVSDAVGNLSTQQSHVLGYVRPLVPGTNNYNLLEMMSGGGMSLVLARSTDSAMISLAPCSQTEVIEWQIGPVGFTWTNLNYECRYTRRVTIDAIEDVTVAAGTFTSCFKFHKQVVSGTSFPRPEWYEWVKPGVGLVKWIDYWDANAPVVYELQSWKPSSQ